MKKTVAIIFCVFALGLPVWAQQTIEEIIAHVNSSIILKSDLDKARAELRKELSDPDKGAFKGAELEKNYAELEKDLLANLIDQALLIQVAKEQNVNVDVKVMQVMEDLREKYSETLTKQFGNATVETLEKALRAQGNDVDEYKQGMKNRFMAAEVIQHEVNGRITITTQEQRDYYEAHTKDFDRPAGVALREIAVGVAADRPEELVSQRKRLEDALAALKKGDAFEDVARKFSESSSVEDGGDLGFIEKGTLLMELEDAIANVEKGQHTGIITLSDRLTILKVEDRHNGGVLPFEIAQREIWQIQMSKRSPLKRQEYLDRLRREGYVTVKEGYVDTGNLSAAAKTAGAQPEKK